MRSERWLLAAAFCVALGVRLVLIWTYPDNFSMDGYQRWAGRDHILVQDWLPATQALVHSVAALGGDILAMRIVMAIVGALAVMAGALVAREIGGLLAGWIFIPLSLFGPFLTWSVVPYQEGAYLLTALGAVGLVLRGRRLAWAREDRRWIWVDLLAGLAPLVRYEGWIFLGLYLLWRRDKRALRAAWGAVLWLGIKVSGVQGYAASPVDFADWGGLTERFDLTALKKTLRKFGRHGLDTWLPVLAALGLTGTAVLWRRKAAGLWMILLLLGLQLAAMLGWMIGLETATYRMQAVPGVLLGLLTAAASGQWIASRSGRIRQVSALAAVGVAVGLAVHFVPQGFDNARRSTQASRWERALIKQMNQCSDCTWHIRPRRGLGTRNRHDGCEILQGLSDYRHGIDFWCTTWPGTSTLDPTHNARWSKGGRKGKAKYKVEGP